MPARVSVRGWRGETWWSKAQRGASANYDKTATHGLFLALATAANPSSQILSAVQMLAHLGELEAAAKLEKALSATFASGMVPLDLGGPATTAQMTDAIIRNIFEL